MAAGTQAASPRRCHSPSGLRNGSNKVPSSAPYPAFGRQGLSRPPVPYPSTCTAVTRCPCLLARGFCAGWQGAGLRARQEPWQTQHKEAKLAKSAQTPTRAAWSFSCHPHTWRMPYSPWSPAAAEVAHVAPSSMKQNCFLDRESLYFLVPARPLAIPRECLAVSDFSPWLRRSFAGPVRAIYRRACPGLSVPPGPALTAGRRG